MTDTKKADQTASPKKTHVDHTSEESLIKAASAFSKQSRILAHLLAGESLNRFDAERLGDHCLPTTISSLTSRFGLLFQHEPEQVPNRFGGLTRVVRHSLPESQHGSARSVLVRMLEGKNLKVAA